jgi:hypothetical protein
VPQAEALDLQVMRAALGQYGCRDVLIIDGVIGFGVSD